MSISQRRHIRITLDIPAFRYTNMGEKICIMLFQISIGGCLIEWDDAIRKDEEFRLEICLPNKNWLPLDCRAVYVSEGDSVGVQFIEITKFEQELIADIVLKDFAKHGITMKIDPFSLPKTYLNQEANVIE